MKIHLNKPGFYLDFKYKVGDLVGRPLKKREVEQTMTDYIHQRTPEECAAGIKDAARKELLG